MTIPKLGLGTWFIDDEKAAQAVTDAVAAGYHNIDTAQAYGNERGVGEGVPTSGIAREELFVSTKLAAEIKNYDDATAAIDRSLATLGGRTQSVGGSGRHSRHATALSSARQSFRVCGMCMRFVELLPGRWNASLHPGCD